MKKNIYISVTNVKEFLISDKIANPPNMFSTRIFNEINYLFFNRPYICIN